MGEFYIGFGKFIRELREQEGISQEMVAKAIGVHRVTYTRMEQGKQMIAFHQVISLSKALRFSFDDLKNLVLSKPNQILINNYSEPVLTELNNIRTKICSSVTIT